MSTVDANRVILTGENSVIRLNDNDSDRFTSNATFWRVLSSPGGPGHVLYLKSELTEARWRIYSDNIAMARWLQSTVLGVINAELLDLTIAVIPTLNSASPVTRVIFGQNVWPAAMRMLCSPGIRWATRSWFTPNPMRFQGVPMGCARCLSRRSALG